MNAWTIQGAINKNKKEQFKQPNAYWQWLDKTNNMGIFNEFRALTTNIDALQMIEALERGGIDRRESMRMAEKVFKLIKPVAPAGKMHMKETYWGQASQRMVWKGLAGISAEKHCKWMHEQRTRYKAHEKPCLFVRIPFVPMPQTGK